MKINKGLYLIATLSIFTLLVVVNTDKSFYSDFIFLFYLDFISVSWSFVNIYFMRKNVRIFRYVLFGQITLLFYILFSYSNNGCDGDFYYRLSYFKTSNINSFYIDNLKIINFFILINLTFTYTINGIVLFKMIKFWNKAKASASL